MKITVNANDLAGLLDKAKGLVSRGKGSMPILQNVLLTAEGLDLTLRSTDLDTTYIGQATATVDKPGALCLPAHKLAEVAKALPAENAVLELKDHALAVSAGATHYRILGLDPADYPEAPENGAAPVPVEGEALLGAIARVAYATNTADSPLWTTGVLFEIMADGADLVLRLAATNGHRMAFCDLGLPCGTERQDLLELGRNVIVPTKAVSAMARLLGGGEVALGLSKNMVTLRAQADRLYARPLAAAFADYDEVVPKAQGPQAVINREALIAAVKRVVLIDSDKSRRLYLELADGVLALSAKDDAMGQADESLEVEWDGPYTELCLNGKYLLDAIGSLASEEVALEPTHTEAGKTGPVVVTADGAETDAGFKGLIMPMADQRPQGGRK